MNILPRILLFVGLHASASCAEWQSTNVPGPIDFAGSSWLRAWVKVDDSFFTPHERNLFEESVGVNIGDLAGAHAVWINGVKIGTGGAFPPNHLAASNANFRHKVPVGTLRKSEWNEIAIHMHSSSRPSGFLRDPPFIMNYFVECVFEGTWEFLPEEAYQPGGALKVKPPRATFESFRESQRVLGRTKQVPGPSLPPLESAAKMQAFDDLKTELLLHEPLVAQPFHFSFDERGRLWVAQSRQYPYPAGVRMISRDKYYRSHYDRIPPAPPNHDRGADIISIHEDTDGDGSYDHHKVFVEGLNMANAVVRGRRGVWVMHTPYLIFYPDEDGDDVPDGPPVVHLSGFGLEDSHSTANGLVWGPDGWLYGAQGSTTSCRVRRLGLDAVDSPGVYFEGCMVWRYQPETRAFEIFADGGGNTFGLEFDAQGRLYSGHNGGSTRGWHFVQGGYYLMQGVDPGKFGPPRNPYAFGDLPMMATTDKVVRFTHFGAFGEGTALPSQLSGLLFALDPLHNEIIASERRVRGSTFETKDRKVVVKCGDPAFRPVYIANAPDGSLFVADMYEFYIAHGQHYQNQIDPTTGRIYRLSGRDSRLESDINLAGKSTDELITLLGRANKWHRHTAARILGERKDPSAASKLRRVIEEDRGLGALNALWALHQSNAADVSTAIVALKHPYPAVRMWAARLLGDTFGVQRDLVLNSARTEAELVPPVFDALLEQAKAERDPEVRSQFAASARRLSNSQAFALTAAIMAHDEDIGDPYIPLLCWWVFESRLPGDSADVMAFFKTPSIWKEPMVIQHILPRIARRLAVDGKRQELLLLAELFRQAPGATQAKQLMIGFEEAFRGRALTGFPDELVSAIAVSGGSSLALRIRQSDSAAIQEALAIVGDFKKRPGERIPFVRIFGELRTAEALPVLLKLSQREADPELRKAAFGALGAYDSDSIASATLAALPDLPTDVRPAAFALLGCRPKWTRMLLAQLEAGVLSLSLMPGDMADRLRAHTDKDIRDLAQKLFPKVNSSSHNANKRLAEVETVLKGAAGNPYAGEPIFMQRCATCHKLFFKGGNIGPELTNYQRDNLGTMLISIINPNAEVREGYQFITLETNDGRTLSGFQVDKDNQVTVIRGLDGQDVTVAAKEIKELRPMGRSLMPDGLLDDLGEQQLRDLFAYLRISQPISN